MKYLAYIYSCSILGRREKCSIQGSLLQVNITAGVITLFLMLWLLSSALLCEIAPEKLGSGFYYFSWYLFSGQFCCFARRCM